VLLDVKQSKKGDAFVITDPTGSVHACATPQDLWDALATMMKDPDIPEPESVPLRGNGVSGETEDDLLVRAAGSIFEGVLGGLRKASYRGTKKKGAEKEGGGG